MKSVESKSHGFESHSYHLVRACGRRYDQVRPVRPKINHFISFHLKMYHTQIHHLSLMLHCLLLMANQLCGVYYVSVTRQRSGQRSMNVLLTF